ncbi:MAG: peroxidase [Pirellulales bacterium]|nr:peroxidase [Pirellulales bacterium]
MPETRTIDGSGNNIEHPTWGKANEALLRNTPTAYEGLNGPSGGNRPNPKLISDIVCAQEEPVENDKGLSDYMWAWGQFLDHEIDLSPEDPREEFPIPLPDGGSIPFARSIYDSSTGTGIGNPRQQMNVLSSFVDAANVYGTNAARAAVLRSFDGTGKLKVSSGNLLPKNPGGLPNAPSSSPQFFIAGDVRANEHVVLACMHTLFVREHNRICDTLTKEPRFKTKSESAEGSYKRGGSESATDETIYQHARRIVSGIMQAITYYEFLPALLGEHALRPYTGYNQNVNPTICNVFSTGPYRLGHSMLSPLVQRVGLKPIPFEETFFSSVPKLVENDGIDPYLAGAATQRMQKIDTKAINAIRTMLFHREPAPLIDLAALNIQRGRDHGLPDYNRCRVAYGLTPKSDFRDISSDPETQQRLKQAYDGDVSLIDPWIGGLAEDHYRDATVGEFFFHVLKDQFERLRDGDRFWYENDLCLTDAEREEIRITTLADVIMRNTTVAGLQKNVFRVRSSGSSPKVGKARPVSRSTRSRKKKSVSRKKKRR